MAWFRHGLAAGWPVPPSLRSQVARDLSTALLDLMEALIHLLGSTRNRTACLCGQVGHVGVIRRFICRTTTCLFLKDYTLTSVSHRLVPLLGISPCP